MNTRFFSVRTQNGQLVDFVKIFAEFNKRCIGLELQTTPLSESSTEIAGKLHPLHTFTAIWMERKGGMGLIKVV